MAGHGQGHVHGARIAGMRELGLLCLAFTLSACGKTSGKVLETVTHDIDAEDRPRVDVFIPHATESCAIGDACTADTSRCFTLSDSNGVVQAFNPGGIDFVPPGDPRITAAPQSGCFRLVVSPTLRTTIAQAFNQLREDVLTLSERRIDLDIRLHDLDTVAAGFKRWENGTGIFLQPTAIEAAGLPLVGADMDFAFAMTGDPEPGTYTPTIQPCGGTNWEMQGGFGGSAYTWLSSSCATESQIRYALLAQAFFGMRDVAGLGESFRRNYPACGRATAEPSTWFPSPSDCGTDPDAPTCGETGCTDDPAFIGHLLTAHWPPHFIGNHCANGVMDFGETDIDVGGVCDRLPRLKP